MDVPDTDRSLWSVEEEDEVGGDLSWRAWSPCGGGTPAQLLRLVAMWAMMRALRGEDINWCQQMKRGSTTKEMNPDWMLMTFST